MLRLVDSFNDFVEIYRMQLRADAGWKPSIDGSSVDSRVARAAWFFVVITSGSDYPRLAQKSPRLTTSISKG